jgi:2-polyprenyl-6-methoxyphenol hydroxylase-like FAD-dependent oxidoreductase
MLSPETLEFLDGLDLLDAVLEKSIRIHAIQLFDGLNRIANLSLGMVPASFPFVASIPQTDLEDILLNRLQKSGKNVLWNHRISSVHRLREGFNIEVDRLSKQMMGYAVMHEETLVDNTLTFLPEVLLAADGVHSLIRRLGKINYEKVGDDFGSLLFEVRRNPREDVVLKLGFSEHGTAAYVPLPHGYGRFGFISDPIGDFSSDRDKSHRFYDDDLEKFPELGDSHFRKLVEERLPSLSDHIKEVTWRASVLFGVRLSESIWTNGIFLLGDAARSGFPMSAKSLNLGMSEAGAVVEALDRYLKDGDDSDLVKQANDIRTEWEDLSSMRYFESKFSTEVNDLNVDPSVIFQALPLTGDSLEYVAEKLEKLMVSRGAMVL